MVQEEQTKKYSTSNGDGDGGISIGHISRSSRKHKQKKVPQRGLGVAQLEKIRLEEQQKNDISVNLPSPPPISLTKPFQSLHANSKHFMNLVLLQPHIFPISHLQFQCLGHRM
ncbi:hypothetical protein OIU85_002319 [Salix viminalis]|uniref:Uncharacterized protein n=1 Tax=Salix viminalis TaxID=40686 RepID=A0A9Q0ZYW7_SALVM|nr:hypothetical protein OIU85_002319 [Salix viminalis]